MLNDPGCGRRFTAELELCEIDARQRTGAEWAARGVAINHSQVWLRSRRMCYPGARLVIKIHHIDDEPFVLVGSVSTCEYEADGMYDIEVSLEAAQNRGALQGGRPAKRPRLATRRTA
ncbi:MAG: hypothetical protein AAGG07_14125 [Planctomycetota bacterium]